MAKHDELIDKLFTDEVKPMKLPPRLAGQIRHAMEAAAKKSKGDKKSTKAAIAAYLTERGYDPKTGKKLEKAKKKGKKAKAEKPAKAKEEKPAKKSKKSDRDPAKEALEKAGASKKAMKGDEDAGVPKGNIDLRKLNRQTLKGMSKDLGVGYKKTWTDDELRAKVAKAMVGIDPTAMEKISKIDSSKLDQSKDCIGVLLDLTKAICITCPAQVDCRQTFEAHRADGWKIFDDLQPGTTVEAVIPAENLGKKAKKLGTGGTPLGLKLDKKSKIEIVSFKKVKKLPKVSVDGKAVESNMAFKPFLVDLKTEKPTTIGAFRDVVLKHYEAEEDDSDATKLTQWFAQYATALGVLKVVA